MRLSFVSCCIKPIWTGSIRFSDLSTFFLWKKPMPVIQTGPSKWNWVMCLRTRSAEQGSETMMSCPPVTSSISLWSLYKAWQASHLKAQATITSPKPRSNCSEVCSIQSDCEWMNSKLDLIGMFNQQMKNRLPRLLHTNTFIWILPWLCRRIIEI